jgi:hypothetical protein
VLCPDGTPAPNGDTSQCLQPTTPPGGGPASGGSYPVMDPLTAAGCAWYPSGCHCMGSAVSVVTCYFTEDLICRGMWMSRRQAGIHSTGQDAINSLEAGVCASGSAMM